MPLVKSYGNPNKKSLISGIKIRVNENSLLIFFENNLTNKFSY